MKRTLLAIMIVILAAGLSGCVRMYSTTDIQADGSGTATIELGMTQTVADALKELQEIDPDASGDQKMPSFADIDKAKIEERIKPYGVKLTQFEKTDADGRETVKMAFAFKDLKGMSAAMGAATGEEPGDGLGIYQDADGNYVLKKATYDFPDYPGKAEEEAKEEKEPTQPTPEQMQKQMEIMGKLMGAMSELDITMKITVPGDIITTNAPEQEGRTSIWTINSSNMMTAGQDMEPNIVFSSKGLKIKDVLKDAE